MTVTTARRRRLSGLLQALRPATVILILLTVAWVALMTVWALVTPAFGAPREADTVDAIFRVALGGGWPATGQMHALNATRWILSDGLLTPTSDHASIAQLLAQHPGDAPELNAMAQHPVTVFAVGAVLLRAVGWASLRWDETVLLLRAVDVVLLAPLPALVFATARRFRMGPIAAACTPVLLFAVPQLAQTGGSVSVWAPMTLLCALVVWLSSRVLSGDSSWRTIVALAVVAGVATATTAAGLLTVVFAVVALVFAPGQLLLRRLIGSALVTAAALAAFAAFAGRYAEAVPSALRGAAAPPLPADRTYTLGNLVDAQWNGFVYSFWGGLGNGDWVLVPPVSIGLAVCAVALLVWALLRRQSELLRAWPLLLWSVLLLGATGVYGAVAARSAHTLIAGRGYLLVLAVTALVVAIAIAARSLVTGPRQARSLTRCGAAGSMLLAFYGISVTYQGFYEGGYFTISGTGLLTLDDASPFGALGVALVVLVWAMGTVATLVLIVTTTRLPATASPDTGPTPDGSGLQGNFAQEI